MSGAYKIVFPKGSSTDESFELWIDGDSYPRFKFDAALRQISTGDGSSPLVLFVSGAGGGPGTGDGVPAPYILAGVDAPAVLKALANGVGDGTAAGDTAALIAALDALGSQPVIGFGTFIMNASHTLTGVNDINLTGDLKIFTPDSAYPQPAIHFTGSRTACSISGLAGGTTLAQGTTQITATVGTLAAGDWCALTVPDLGWSTRPGENFAGEWLQVESNTAGVLTFKTPFRTSYNLTGKTLELFKLNPILRCNVDGIRMHGVGSTGHPDQDGTTNRERMFCITYALAPNVTNVYAEGPYAREGIALYECIYPTIRGFKIKDVNDIAGPAGVYEAYGIRCQGCEGALIEDGYGAGCRHVIEVNGGQSAYGLSAGHTRPISYDTTIRKVRVVKSWAAAVGDHPGCVGTTFEDIYANGCSGAVFVRGARARVRNVTMVGGHHFVGPYNAAQGNDHCITLGEQQRDVSGNADNTTRDGVCGTNIIIDGIQHDMTGNGNTPAGQASTSHTIHAVHPLNDAYINLGSNCKPTGNAVNAIGMYNRNVRIVGETDLSAAFSGAGKGSAVVLTPAACVPAVTTGQFSSDIKIDIDCLKPRNAPIIISGSADAANPSDRIEILLRSRTLGSGMTSSSPMVILDANPNGTTGQFGAVKIEDMDAVAVARATAVTTSSAAIVNLMWQGASRFSDGYKVDDVPWLSSGMVRIPRTTGLATVTPTSGDRSVLYLWKVRGCGQTFTNANMGVTAIGTNDGVAFGIRVGAFADDGTGNAPAIGVAPLFASGLLGTGTTGNVNSAITFVEPVGDYWVGAVMQYTTAPTVTFPTLVSLANPQLMPPVGLISTGTTVNQARVWKQTSVTGALVALTAITQDQSAHILAGPAI